MKALIVLLFVMVFFGREVRHAARPLLHVLECAAAQAAR